jgi:hypothetical protein
MHSACSQPPETVGVLGSRKEWDHCPLASDMHRTGLGADLFTYLGHSHVVCRRFCHAFCPVVQYRRE